MSVNGIAFDSPVPDSRQSYMPNNNQPNWGYTNPGNGHVLKQSGSFQQPPTRYTVPAQSNSGGYGQNDSYQGVNKSYRQSNTYTRMDSHTNNTYNQYPSNARPSHPYTSPGNGGPMPTASQRAPVTIRNTTGNQKIFQETPS